MTQPALHDPKGLIREAFRIEGITIEECRSIFLDWALGLPPGEDAPQHVRAALSQYSETVADTHPMFAVLQDALKAPPTPRRRGGRGARVQDS